MYSNPNSLFTYETLETLKRSATQLMVGEIVDLEGDGGYRNNLIQQYSVKLQGFGTLLKNCKVSTRNAGFNGTGEYHSYRPGDLVIGVAKDGMLEEFIITGAIRVNGDHQKFFREGQALKPGELVPHAFGDAASNQVSIHPARATKPNAQFNIVPAENIKTEFEDPIFFDGLKDRQNAEPLPGMVLMNTTGGDIVTYGYGSIINYSDGNNIILSAGTNENKCTRHLKAAKRHSLISQFLSFVSPPTNKVEEFNKAKEYKVAEEIVFNPFDAAVSRTFEPGVISITSADTTAALNKALGPPDKPTTGLTPISTAEQLGSSEIVENSDHPAPASYRKEEHARLAELNVTQAEICNRMMAAMQTQAGGMTPQTGGSTPNSTNPNQQNAFVHPGNKAVRSVLPGCKGHIQYPECPASELVDVGNSQKLRKTAAKSFLAMVAGAKKDGKTLFAYSAFRSIALQKETFEKNFANKSNPTPAEIEERCKVSAPPGYSEHSTGYALDINSVKDSFGDSDEFNWLNANARQYGWELSFTKDQKLVSYEPWHWRYIGGGSKNPNKDTPVSPVSPVLDIATIAKNNSLQSLFVLKLSSNKSASYNSSVSPKSPASTIKLAVGLLTINHLSMSKSLSFDSSILPDGEATYSATSTITVSEALKLMLKDSNNAATNALIKALGGPSGATTKIHSLGLTSTAIGYLSLPGATIANSVNKSSASQLAGALKSIWQGSSAGANIAKQALKDNIYHIGYTNEIAGKIGFNSAVIGNIGLANINNQEYIIAAYAELPGLEHKDKIRTASQAVVDAIKAKPDVI